MTVPTSPVEIMGFAEIWTETSPVSVLHRMLGKSAKHVGLHFLITHVLPSYTPNGNELITQM